MPKIRKIKVGDRKDSRGGGYSRRKFTVAEADAIRLEFNTSESKITISAMARKYEVSQPLMYQLLKGTTYTDKGVGGMKGTGGKGVQGMAMKKEARVQSAFCTYIQFAYPSVRYCASLGGIRTSMTQAIMAKKTGYVKGFPDMQICKVNSEYAGLFLEIKADKTGYASKEQKQWVADLNEAGYFAKVVKGLEECMDVLDWYMKIK